MRTELAVLLLIAVAVAACVGPTAERGSAATLQTPLGSAATLQTPLGSAATPSKVARPVDPAIPAESRSNLTDGARNALALCGMLQSMDLVAGIGPLDHARDAVKYAPFYGTEPDLRTDDPAWVITTKGRFQLRATSAVEPTCVVVNGEAAWLLTGGANVEGKFQPPLEPQVPPTLRLPPLDP